MKNKKIISIISLLILTFVLILSYQNFKLIPQNNPQPNVLIIMFDDLGYGQFFDPSIATPNLRKIKNKGLLLNKFYVHPMCTPTRVAALSGNNPLRHGLHRATGSSVGDGQKSRGVHVNETTLPSLFRQAGYVTAHVGKWHASSMSGPESPKGLYDHMEIWGGTNGSAYNPTLSYFDHNQSWPVSAKRETTYPGFLDGQTSSSVNELITRRPTNKPFFINYWPLIPHSPFEKTPSYPNRPNYPSTPEGAQHDMISFMDAKIGEIMSTLRSEGLLDNTLVLIYSDNGGVPPPTYGSTPPVRSVSGSLRGYKSDIFEGGIRNQMIVHWPAQINGSALGKTNSSILNVEDLLPTMADLVGLPDYKSSWRYGTSFLKLLNTKNAQTILNRAEPSYFMQTDMLDYNSPNAPTDKVALFYIYSMIESQWKLVRHYGQDLLFNLNSDPNEKNNVASANPTIVSQMKNKFMDFKISSSKLNLSFTRAATGTSVSNNSRFYFSDLSTGHFELKTPTTLKSYNEPITFTATIKTSIQNKERVIAEVPGIWKFFISSQNNLTFTFLERFKNSKATPTWKTINAGNIKLNEPTRVSFVIFPTHEYFGIISVYNHLVSSTAPIKISAKSNYSRFATVNDPKLYLGSINASTTFKGFIESPTFYLTHFPDFEIAQLFPPKGIIEHNDANCSLNNDYSISDIINHRGRFRGYKSRYVSSSSDCNSSSQSQMRQCLNGIITGDSSMKHTICSEVPSGLETYCNITTDKTSYRPNERVIMSWDTNYANTAYLYPTPSGKVLLKGSQTFNAPAAIGNTKYYLKVNGPLGPKTCIANINVR